MSEFVGSREIVNGMKRKVLGGAKTPHTCSFPVLRKVDGEYKLAFFVQLINREQMKKQVTQRPSYWCYADLANGANFAENSCKAREFSKAPYDRLYPKGTPMRTAVQEDVDRLYAQLDQIRQNYLRDGVLDAFAYKGYLEELLSLIPSGQRNFYKELSKLTE